MHGMTRVWTSMIFITMVTGSIFGRMPLVEAPETKVPEVEWARTFGGPHPDRGYSIQPTLDGGYILCGTTESYGAGASDVWVLKLNSQGKPQWNQTYGGSAGDYGYSIHPTPEGGYIFLGYTASFGPAGQWLVKLDPRGAIEWAQIIKFPKEGIPNVLRTPDGGYLITGKKWRKEGTPPMSFSFADIWISKYSDVGRPVWNHTLERSGHEVVYDMALAPDGGYLLVGGCSPPADSPWDAYVVKLNEVGEIEWDRKYWIQFRIIM